MSDLLTRIAKDRSPEAFATLYRDYGPRIKSFMQRLGADADVAEDLAQETLLAVWKKAHHYSVEKGSPSTWVFTIARNLRIDRLRREFAWQKLAEPQWEAIPSDEPGQEDVVGQEQRRLRVQLALADLPADQRDVLKLSFIDGLSHMEIAERLSLPLGTVKSRTRLAYQKVRAALEDLK